MAMVVRLGIALHYTTVLSSLVSNASYPLTYPVEIR